MPILENTQAYIPCNIYPVIASAMTHIFISASDINTVQGNFKFKFIRNTMVFE